MPYPSFALSIPAVRKFYEQLTPHPEHAGGAQMRVQGSVDVRIPMVGRQIEKVIANQLIDLATTRCDFTNSWISQDS